MNHMGPDLLTMQIIQGRFDSIIKEVCYKLIRSSYSSIIRESEDMGTAIFTVQGEELCESETTPMMIGGMNGYVNGLLRAFNERGIEPNEGDAYIHNHPYYGASHASDIGVITPIFRNGIQVGWCATAAHHVDVGSWLPNAAITTPDFFGEATYFLGEKLFDRGKKSTDIWHLIENNVRVPTQVIGDLEAQVGACRIGENRFLELLEEYGEEMVFNTGKALLHYSERLIREQIKKVPDGVYEAEEYLDSDGKNHDRTLPVRVKVKIEDDHLEIDLTGSADQVSTARNVPYEGSTCTAIYFTCKTIFMDQALFSGFIPQNSGMFRPIEIKAPSGSIFNPRFPAACNDRFNQIQALSDTIIKALAPVTALCAGTSGNSMPITYSGIDPKTEKYWLYLGTNGGAYGGSEGKDGMSAVSILVANTRNSPIEHVEMEFPLRVTGFQFFEDSAGAGKWRSGFGIKKSVKFLQPGKLTVQADKGKQNPWGFQNGKEGQPCRVTKILADGKRITLKCLFEGEPFNEGDQVEYTAGSGGGWGNPLERDEKLVLEDYLDGLISRDSAEAEYGVVISTDNTIDYDATDRLRNAGRAAG